MPRKIREEGVFMMDEDLRSPKRLKKRSRTENMLPLTDSESETFVSLSGDVKKHVSPQDFVRLRLLGKGDIGRVYLVKFRPTGKFFAMKMLSKEEIIQRNKVHRALTEREILEKANHPFVVGLHYAFQSEHWLYFVLDYCGCGELYRLLHSQPNHCISEDQARFYVAEITLALEYLHTLGYIYRDLKPENILLREDGHIALSDFDLAKGSSEPPNLRYIRKRFGSEKYKFEAKPKVLTNSFVGTEEYIAPEVIIGFGHSSAVDWWTLGILLFEMLFGTTPFRGKTREETFGNIKNGELRFPEGAKISKECMSLIRNLLHPDPKKRLGYAHGASDVKSHPWFEGIQWSLVRHMQPPIIPSPVVDLSMLTDEPIQDDIDMQHEEALEEISDKDPFVEFRTVIRDLASETIEKYAPPVPPAHTIEVVGLSDDDNEGVPVLVSKPSVAAE